MALGKIARATSLPQTKNRGQPLTLTGGERSFAETGLNGEVPKPAVGLSTVEPRITPEQSPMDLTMRL
jgi:hypothetical protein